MDLRISGKTAVICGASRGLGFACADALAAEGVRPTLVARGADDLKGAVERISQQRRRRSDYIVADLSTMQGVDEVVSRCSTPDILITNAGGPPSADFRKLTRQDWDKAFDLSFHPSERLIRKLIGSMIEKGFGRIVNITSMSVRAPIQDLDLSNAARLALTGYVAGVARKVAMTGVTVNNLLPGPIATERLTELGDLAARLTKAVPMGRAGNPDEFGAVCAFLCSRQAAFITGQNVLVDGGYCTFSV